MPHRDEEKTHKYYVSLDIKASDLKPTQKKVKTFAKAKASKTNSNSKSPRALENKTLVKNNGTQVNTLSESPESLSYKEELYQFLKSKDHYPPIAAKLKHSGRVQVRIKIDKDGNFVDVDLISPSNHKTLNQGTLSFLKRIAYFKPLPKLLNSQTFEVPIVYEL